MTDLKKLHQMVDLYGVDPSRSENVQNVYELLSWINHEAFSDCGIIQLIPVVDKTESLNNGISGIINAPFGHFTIHTFSQRGVAFVDLFGEALERELTIISAIKHSMPYASSNQRQEERKEEEYNFGKHLVLRCDYIPLITAVRLIDQIISTIKMTPLGRANVILNRENDYDLIRPITESHIAFHSPGNYRTWIDIFSCKAFDSHDILKLFNEIWSIRPQAAYQVSRGTRMHLG